MINFYDIIEHRSLKQTLALVNSHAQVQSMTETAPPTLRSETFETIPVPHVWVISRPCLLGPDELEDLTIQFIGLPWVSRSIRMTNFLDLK